MDSLKHEMLAELDNRISRLHQHANDKKAEGKSPYSKLNHALSQIIGETLETEFTDLRNFTEKL